MSLRPQPLPPVPAATAAAVQAAAMEQYASQLDAAAYYLARMVEANEDPKFIARRMVIFASELKVPSGRGHAAPASLVNLKILEDRVIESLVARFAEDQVKVCSCHWTEVLKVCY